MNNFLGIFNYIMEIKKFSLSSFLIFLKHEERQNFEEMKWGSMFNFLRDLYLYNKNFINKLVLEYIIL